MYSRAGSKVLVVDDEESVRGLIQQVLKKAAYDVVTAAGGQEALNTIGRGDIGVVLLDIKMPGMSGIDVLKNVATHWPDICVIMVTAVADTETAVEAMKLGAYDYITKPLNRDNLILRVQRAIERRNLRLQSEHQRTLLENKVRDQTEQLQAYFRDLMDTLMREHNLLYKHSMDQPRGSKAQPFSKLPPELQQPMGSIEEYRDALLRILKRTQTIPGEGPSAGNKKLGP